MKTEILEVNGKKFLVKVHYEQRKTITFSVGKNINIRIPNFLSRDEKIRWEAKLKRKAKKIIETHPQKFQKQKQKTYHDNQVLKMGDEEYILNIEKKDKQSSSARIDNNIIKFSIISQLSEEEQNKHVSTLLSRIMVTKKLPELKETIDGLNKKHFNQNINKVFFKNNKTNWGSCSENKNINISIRLLFAPKEVLEYVCIHELAHLIEQNHSKKFWKLVEQAVPDYKEKIKWLKENGKECVF